MMGGRAKLVLLDAGAVFGALEHDAWEGLTNAYEVVVPRIVLDEVQFYMSRGTGKRVYVDTDEWIRAGAIVCYEATACAVAETLKLINWPDGPDIHDGEAEALTYLRLQVDPLAEHVAFVSADGAAIQATALLGLSHTARSLDEVMLAIGITKSLPARHRRGFVQQHLEKGLQRRLRRPGNPQTADQ